MLYATTRQFLDDLGVASLDQLPPLESPATVNALFNPLSAVDEVDPAQIPMALEDLPLDVPGESPA